MVSSASSHGYGSKVRPAHQIGAGGSRHGKFARASAAAGAGRRGVERSEGHYSTRARDSAASTRSAESDAFLVFDNLNQEPHGEIDRKIDSRPATRRYERQNSACYKSCNWRAARTW